MEDLIRRRNNLVVGAGLTGAVIARVLAETFEEDVTVIDIRNTIGGMCGSAIDPISSVSYHTGGPHIFHTNSRGVWDFVNRFCEWVPYKNIVYYNCDYPNRNGIYNFPINLQTVSQFFKKNLRPDNVDAFIEYTKKNDNIKIDDPTLNAETYLYSLVGKELTDAFFRPYSEKQWGCSLSEIPYQVVKRVNPDFKTLSNSYFKDTYQALPKTSYNHFISNLLHHERINVVLGNSNIINCDSDVINMYDAVYYTGSIDTFYKFKLGGLEYRGLKFSYSIGEVSQGNAVINHGERTGTFKNITRTTEYNLLLPEENKSRLRLMGFEHPFSCKSSNLTHIDEINRHYPVNNDRNMSVYNRYVEHHSKNSFRDKVFFCGRLGLYRYMNMDKAIEAAFNTVTKSRLTMNLNDVFKLCPGYKA